MCKQDPAHYAGHAPVRATPSLLQPCVREAGQTPFTTPAQNDDGDATLRKPRPVAILAGFAPRQAARGAIHIELAGYATLIAASAEETLASARLWSAALVVIDIDNIDDYAPRLIACLAATHTPDTPEIPDETAAMRRIVAVGDFIPVELRLQLLQAGADACRQRRLGAPSDFSVLDDVL